jgi:tRNA threonylcarbamoyladenosine biosynthesis protein TsaE
MEAEPSAITMRSHSPEETERIAEQLARSLSGGWAVTLVGALGAGKTCFVRGLARGLGVDPRQVSSPTFIVVNEYEAMNAAANAIRLIHIDAYRLSGEESLESLGWDELLADPQAVLAIEWPERVGGELPVRRIEATIDHVADGSRMITLTGDADLLAAAFADLG